MTTTNRPDIFIVGTMKGGTTILHEFLAHHPLIHSGREKEIHYFSLYESKGLDWYHGQFEGLPAGQHYMDASPTYFDMTNAPVIPNKINAYNPDARVIMLSRHPIQRAVSHFNHLKKVNQINALDNVTADEFLSRGTDLAMAGTSAADIFLQHVLDFSCYYRKALHYNRIFGDRFMVIANASLSRDPQQTMQRAFHHVGVDPISSPAFGERKYSHMSKDEAQISAQTHARLTALFQPNYRAFCKLVGVDFEW